MVHSVQDQISQNLQRVQQQIANACCAANRPVNSVQLIAVTKYAEPSWVQALYELGLRDFGESRPQQLAQRAAQLPDDIRWHLIGHLQRNKVSLVAPWIHQIHSVDSVRLAVELSREGQKLGRELSLLLEVNVSGEKSKDGFSPMSVRNAWNELCGLTAIEWAGLMTMAPLNESPSAACPIFRKLRELRDELQATADRPCLTELSMGMSGDLAAAIHEGATCVRIGTALFEHLT